MGYTVWSLMDGIDWKFGSKAKFGLYHVDFNDPQLPRTAKLSAKIYSQIIDQNGIISDIRNITTTDVSGNKENDPYRALKYEDEMYYGKFPAGFAWSSATASYQVEGAWNEDGITIKQTKNVTEILNSRFCDQAFNEGKKNKYHYYKQV